MSLKGCPCCKGIHVRREACRKLRQRYGITLADREVIFAKQQGKCKLCPAPATKLDHCHKTGMIRGLVCDRCNVWLAPLDDHQWLVRAASYLMGPKTIINRAI